MVSQNGRHERSVPIPIPTVNRSTFAKQKLHNVDATLTGRNVQRSPTVVIARRQISAVLFKRLQLPQIRSLRSTTTSLICILGRVLK